MVNKWRDACERGILLVGAEGVPPMRVLLIEDEPTTARAIELMLTTEGFNVYSTDLGEEGLDLGKLYDYDIILLDLNWLETGHNVTGHRHNVTERITFLVKVDDSFINDIIYIFNLSYIG